MVGVFVAGKEVCVTASGNFFGYHWLWSFPCGYGMHGSQSILPCYCQRRPRNMPLVSAKIELVSLAVGMEPIAWSGITLHSPLPYSLMIVHVAGIDYK